MLKSISEEEFLNLKAEKAYRAGKRQSDVFSFYESGERIAEVVVKQDEKYQNVTAGFVTVIKRLGLPIRVTTRQQRIFLIRTDVEGAADVK